VRWAERGIEELAVDLPGAVAAIELERRRCAIGTLLIREAGAAASASRAASHERDEDLTVVTTRGSTTLNCRMSVRER